jgi:hypothetical protein
MVWIKSDSKLIDSDKFKKFQSLLNLGKRDAFWNIHKFWYWISAHFPGGSFSVDNGNVNFLEVGHLGDIMECKRDPKLILSALFTSGFVDKTAESEYEVHDWDEWRSDPIRSRHRRLVERPGCDQVATNSKHSSSPSLLSFKTSGKEKIWELREEHVKKLQELYPAVNILETCKKAHFWTENNPKRIKTSKRMLQWLATIWCEKEQNRGGIKNGLSDDNSIREKWRNHDDHANRVVSEFLKSKQ